MYQRILYYFLIFLLDDDGLAANVDGVGPNKLLCGSFFDGDFWLKRLTAFCGDMIGKIDGWFCMNEGTLLMAYILAAWADCAELINILFGCWLPNNPPVVWPCWPPNIPPTVWLNETGLTFPNNPLLPPAWGKALPVWLLNDALRKLPLRLFPPVKILLFCITWLFPGVIFDYDYSHIDESRFEYCDVLWTGDWKDAGLILCGWRCGDNAVNNVLFVVANVTVLNTLAVSFLVFINVSNKSLFTIFEFAAKNGLYFAAGGYGFFYT